MPLGRFRSLIIGCQFAIRIAVHAVELQLLRRVLILLQEAVGRIGEIQGSVGSVDQVVGAVEALALELLKVRRHGQVLGHAHDAAVGVLAQQDEAVLIGDHSVRTDERAGRRGAFAAGLLDQHGHLSGGRHRAQHVADDVAEPDDTFRPPQRPFREVESAGDLLDHRVLRHQRVEGGVEANDAADARRGGSKSRRRRTGTSGQQRRQRDDCEKGFHVTKPSFPPTPANKIKRTRRAAPEVSRIFGLPFTRTNYRFRSVLLCSGGGHDTATRQPDCAYYTLGVSCFASIGCPAGVVQRYFERPAKSSRLRFVFRLVSVVCGPNNPHVNDTDCSQSSLSLKLCR